MSKKICKPRNHSAPHIYEHYIGMLITKNKGWRIRIDGGVYNEEGKLVINYKQFKAILAETNKEVGRKIIKGYSVNLLNGLGALFILRIKRNPNKPRMNRAASFKLRKELEKKGELDGKNWQIYYTDDEYIRLKHYRPAGTKGLYFYRFVPAKGGNGFKSKMSKAVSTGVVTLSNYPYAKAKTA